MKKVLLNLIALIFISCVVSAQKKTSIKISCAPDNIHIRNICTDTLNKHLYACYTYGEAYKTLHYEIAKYDGKDWKVIAKFDKIKDAKWDAEEPVIKQMCAIGNAFYIYGNITQCEQGKELKKYDSKNDVFKYENGNWTVLKSGARNIIGYNNSLWTEISADHSFSKWNGSEWEKVASMLQEGWFQQKSYTVFNNNLYAIINTPSGFGKSSMTFVAKFDGKSWEEVQLNITDFESADFVPKELFTSNGKFLIAGINKKGPPDEQRCAFIYNKGSMTRIFSNYADFLIRYPSALEFYSSANDKFTVIVQGRPKANEDSLCVVAVTCNSSGNITSTEQLLTLGKNYPPKIILKEVSARENNKIYIGYSTINPKSASVIPVLNYEDKANRLFYYEIK